MKFTQLETDTTLPVTHTTKYVIVQADKNDSKSFCQHTSFNVSMWTPLCVAQIILQWHKLFTYCKLVKQCILLQQVLPPSRQTHTKCNYKNKATTANQRNGQIQLEHAVMYNEISNNTTVETEIEQKFICNKVQLSLLTYANDLRVLT